MRQFGGRDSSVTKAVPPNEADTSGSERTGDAGPEATESLAAPKDEVDPLVGTVVGERYCVTRLIGLGGMGAVYRAEHVHMKKTVALKVLHREMTALPEVVARFEREAIAAGRIEHPNVVQARDFGRLDDGAFYLVLEYVEGRALGDILQEGPLPIERVLAIAGQIAEALGAAHQQNIVHRDLKPDNVMLVERPGEPELVKVLDFGIAKVTLRDRGPSDRPITKMGTVFGTPEYMSPEQAAGQAVDQRGDLYSLGILMYEMLSGAPPFSGEEVNAVLMMQITQSPPPLPSSVPLVVRQLVGELLAKEPEQRVGSADEVVQRIVALIGGEVPLPQSKTRTRLVSIKSYPRITWVQRLDSGRLGRPVQVAGASVPAWRLAAFAGVLAALGFVLVLLLTLDDESAHYEVPVVAARSASGVSPIDAGRASHEIDPEEDKLLGRVFLGDPEALQQLEARPRDTLSAREWLAMARGRVKLSRDGPAMQAYRAALEKDPSLGEDPVLRRDVWQATRSEQTAELALHLAADFLGSKGADLLYRFWVESKDVTPLTRLAKKLVYSERVRETASPALAFVLDWRAAITCDDYEGILPRAQLSGDMRALTVLQRSLRNNDCQLSEDALEAAIMVAKDRPEPPPF